MSLIISLRYYYEIMIVLVTVNLLPDADAGPDLSLCSATTDTIHASGGVSYAWSPSNGLDDPSSSNPAVTPTSSVPGRGGRKTAPFLSAIHKPNQLIALTLCSCSVPRLGATRVFGGEQRSHPP